PIKDSGTRSGHATVRSGLWWLEAVCASKIQAYGRVLFGESGRVRNSCREGLRFRCPTQVYEARSELASPRRAISGHRADQGLPRPAGLKVAFRWRSLALPAVPARSAAPDRRRRFRVIEGGRP